MDPSHIALAVGLIAAALAVAVATAILGAFAP